MNNKLLYDNENILNQIQNFGDIVLRIHTQFAGNEVDRSQFFAPRYLELKRFLARNSLRFMPEDIFMVNAGIPRYEIKEIFENLEGNKEIFERFYLQANNDGSYSVVLKEGEGS